MRIRYKSHNSNKQVKAFDAAHCQLKIVGDDAGSTGFLEGYASVFNNVDEGKDTVVPGAFTKTLKENLGKGRIKLVDSHKIYEGTEAIIGIIEEAHEDEHGLKFRARFSGVARAQEIRQKIKEGILDALSFGYTVVKEAVVDNVRQLKEVRLLEISVVPWGMNPLAGITGVKGVCSFQDFGVHPDVMAPWDANAARKRAQAWVSDADPSEWTDADWSKYGKCFLWVDTANKTSLGAYKFQVADIIDGTPQYIFRACSAALAVIRGGRGGGPGSTWWADRNDLESQVAKIYKKFDKPMPAKEATIELMSKVLNQCAEALGRRKKDSSTSGSGEPGSQDPGSQDEPPSPMDDMADSVMSMISLIVQLGEAFDQMENLPEDVQGMLGSLSEEALYLAAALTDMEAAGTVVDQSEEALASLVTDVTQAASVLKSVQLENVLGTISQFAKELSCR